MTTGFGESNELHSLNICSLCIATHNLTATLGSLFITLLSDLTTYVAVNPDNIDYMIDYMHRC
jgi:hypothetical protein